MMRKYCTHFT